MKQMASCTLPQKHPHQQTDDPNNDLKVHLTKKSTTKIPIKQQATAIFTPIQETKSNSSTQNNTNKNNKITSINNIKTNNNMDSSSVNSELTDLNNPDVPIDQKIMLHNKWRISAKDHRGKYQLRAYPLDKNNQKLSKSPSFKIQNEKDADKDEKERLEDFCLSITNLKKEESEWFNYSKDTPLYGKISTSKKSHTYMSHTGYHNPCPIAFCCCTPCCRTISRELINEENQRQIGSSEMPKYCCCGIFEGKAKEQCCYNHIINNKYKYKITKPCITKGSVLNCLTYTIFRFCFPCIKNKQFFVSYELQYENGKQYQMIHKKVQKEFCCKSIFLHQLFRKKYYDLEFQPDQGRHERMEILNTLGLIDVAM